MVVTRSSFNKERKSDIIWKRQRKYNLLNHITHKNCLKRIKLPYCKKSYKDPIKEEIPYISVMCVGFYYLRKKYGNITISCCKYDFESKKLILNRLFFKNYHENNIIYIDLSIKYKIGWHANILVIDKINKHMHLFEPSGFNNSINDILDKFKEILIGFTSSFSNWDPLQRIDHNVRYPSERGYCFTWCIFFIEVCLLNKNIQSRDIDKTLAKIFKNINTLQYIRGYSKYHSKVIKLLNLKNPPKVSNCGNYIVNLQELISKIY
jgi:hypothetical protein